VRRSLPLLLGLLAAGGVSAEPLRLEEVLVTADRVPQAAADVSAHVTVLGRDEVERTAALTVDDFLRQVPGFQLFRRQSSLVANPTSQGVSLRGLGASGASRTLVLLDGVPLNDLFGGWVPWSRVPLEALERVEIVRGPPANPWGNYALGGVINLITRPPERREVDVAAEGGNHATVRVDARAAERAGALGVQLLGNYFDTGGYPVVPDDQRGAIDENASSQHGVFDARAEWRPSPRIDAHVHTNLFTETRANGTPLTDNASDAADVDLGVRLHTGDGSDWSLLGFTKLAEFESRFSTQAADRRSERPAVDQFDVPSQAAGGALVWRRALGARTRLHGGADGLWLEGETDENARFLGGAFTRRREAGARQLLAGGWAQIASSALFPLEVTLGLRLDAWRTFDGFRRERALDGGGRLRDDRFPAEHAVLANPALTLRYPIADTWALRGGAYRGFRAPTVNELVRGFRVRNDVTEPNPELQPERLTGGELGIERLGARWNAQLTGYWNVVDDAITNVTVGGGPGDVAPCGPVPAGGVCRQRQNLGATRVRGVEGDVALRLGRHWTATAGYLVSDPRVVDAPAEPALEGRRVAQVPRYLGSAGVAYTPPTGPTGALQVRYVGQQYEDDLNTLSLGGFAVVDLFLGWRFASRWEVFFRIENLLDRTYAVGRSADGLETVGPPLLAHGGVRARF
jgi:outer membrane cobalamin receptor